VGEEDPTQRRTGAKKTSFWLGIALWLTICGGCMYTVYDGLTRISDGLRGLADDALTPGPCETEHPNRIQNTQNLGQFEFPPSATNIETGCGGLQGWGASAAFDMLPSDLPVLLNNSRITELSPDFPSNVQGHSPYQFMVTQAATMRAYLYGWRSEPEFLIEILIDTTNPALYHVTINVFGG
jgi:hypothetical protein